MAEGGTSFREVVPNDGSPTRWKEITVNTGSSVSTLQDIKLPESAGGYTYRDSGKVGSPARNRFIYWRTSHDILELVEESLDFNLNGNCVRFRFQDAPILNGISVHEAHGFVIILVATVSSVHRLMFPHPIKLQRYDNLYRQGGEQSVLSIFADASIASAQDPSNLHPISQNGGVNYQIHTSASWLTTEGEALFAMATNVGTIVLIKLPPSGIQGIVTQQELRQSSMMQRLWTGLVPVAIRGGQDASDATLSLCIHPIGTEYYIFAVCRDHKLRMWSCKEHECLMAADLLEYMPDGIDPSKTAIGAQGHILKRALGSTVQDIFLGIFLSFADRCQFCIFQPVLSDGQFQIRHTSTLFAENEDLVDFCVTGSHVWTLWTNGESECTAKFATLESEWADIENWCQVFLQPAERSDIDIPMNKDPRETYMENIFLPGRFSTQAIIKALNIYRRSFGSQLHTEMTISINLLKEEVTTVVEAEIQKSLSEYEMTEEEYYQTQVQQWSKFYSCCLQYHEVGARPVGLFADNTTGMVGIIKKNMVTFLRPCDSLEHLFLSPMEYCMPEDFSDSHLMYADVQLCTDIIRLGDCMKIVNKQLSQELQVACEQELFLLESPQNIASHFINIIISSPGADGQVNCDMIAEVELKLHSISDILRSLDTLLLMLDLAHGETDRLFIEDPALDASRQLSCSHLFSSSKAIDIISQSVGQTADIRFQTARDLLLVATLITRIADQAGLPLGVVERLQSDTIPRLAGMVQAYHLLKWISKTAASPVQPNTMDTNLRQLAALDIGETDGMTSGPKIATQNITLVEIFLKSVGGLQTRLILAMKNFLTDDPCALWNVALLPATKIVSQLLWPNSVNFLFPEFLMNRCQYLQLQEYIRLLQQWCEFNFSSRLFLLGQCYLNSNEPEKAQDCFLQAAHGVTQDEFLLNKLLQGEDQDGAKMVVLYYLKVIRLLEQFGLPDLVISMATKAIDVADNDDTNIPTLWSKVFKYHLELGHNQQAYEAMISNPDPSRRKDCLRQFIVILCERSQLQALVEFPYVDLHDDVVNIIESRSRSVDLATHNYYELLYSFHIFRGNFRKAGSVMYEYGMRLGTELPGLKGLQKQAKCYLAALNSLRLVDSNYAWIVKPVPTIKQSLIIEEEAPGMSPKRSADGEEKSDDKGRRMEVLELSEIEREYLLVVARLRLIQKDLEPAHMQGPTLSAAEMVGLLVNAGLFDNAVTICRAYKISLGTVMEGLAARCVKLAQHSNYFMQGDNDYTSDAWDWLLDNDAGSHHPAKEISSADQSWRLLQVYLEKYEDKTGLYHRAVAKKLLAQGFELPNWFIASYKKLNAAELLRLLLDHDLLEEAAVLAIEYIDAVRGQGKEYFGLKTCLHYKAPCVWLPYTSIEQLLMALKDVQTESIYARLYHDLKDKLKEYHQTVKEVSNDMISEAGMTARIG